MSDTIKKTKKQDPEVSKLKHLRTKRTNIKKEIAQAGATNEQHKINKSKAIIQLQSIATTTPEGKAALKWIAANAKAKNYLHTSLRTYMYTMQASEEVDELIKMKKQEEVQLNEDIREQESKMSTGAGRAPPPPPVTEAVSKAVFDADSEFFLE